MENDSNGKSLLKVSETKEIPTVTGIYEYSFSTNANTIYIADTGTDAYMDFPDIRFPYPTETLTDLKNHKVVLIKLISHDLTFQYGD